MLSVSACKKSEAVQAEHLQISPEDICVTPLTTITVSVLVYPKAAAAGIYDDLEWSSDNPNIVKVQKESKNIASVTGLQMGTSFIRVKYGDLSSKCLVTVE